MTRFELLYKVLFPLEHPLNQHVRRTLRSLNPPHLLDVGGRRSNYTIGLPNVWVSDIPREKAIQYQLDLGATDAIRKDVLTRRSNVREYVYDDMTETKLLPESFDAINATEVLEHVDEDEKFVANVARVLKPGGHFVMSTPNGDFRPVPYPDHKRHYRTTQLENLLRKYFTDVRVDYCVNASPLNELARKSRVLGMFIYGMLAMLERLGIGGEGPEGKLHLFAVCKK